MRSSTSRQRRSVCSGVRAGSVSRSAPFRLQASALPRRCGRSTIFSPPIAKSRRRWPPCNRTPAETVTRSSYVIVPVVVALAAIQRSMDAAAPRELAGKNDNPVSSLLSKADIGITITRQVAP